MTDFEKFKEKLSSNEEFHNLLPGKKIHDKEYDHVLKACVYYFLIIFLFFTK